MAYNFLAESRHELDWANILDRLRETGGLIEAFPIPSTELDEPDAIGVSLPQKHANGLGAMQLQAFLEFLIRELEMDVTELYSGRTISIDDLPLISESAGPGPIR